MKKKLIMGCVVVIVVFGVMSHWINKHREEAETDWTMFLVDKGVGMDTIRRYGALTHKETAALNGKIGKADLELKEELWGNYRYYDYWRSVFRSIAAIAVLIITVNVLKAILSRIYVSESFYRRFYLPPDQTGTDRKEPDD